jgi:hypothetical protein
MGEYGQLETIPPMFSESIWSIGRVNVITTPIFWTKHPFVDEKFAPDACQMPITHMHISPENLGFRGEKGGQSIRLVPKDLVDRSQTT